jgi:hyperosmotically inducible periplasmic protein
MRKLKVVLCAGALAACASSKSAERPDEEWTESTDPSATQSVEAVGDTNPDAVPAEDRDLIADGDRDERASRVERRADAAERRADAARERDKAADRRGEAAQERAKATEERADQRADLKRPAQGAGVAAPPDNTDVNERDSDEDTLTPIDQGGSEGDRKITQQIRQAVMDDDSLSFTAKNVKIITVDGKVTLRGPVKSEQERTAIGAAAKKVAGARVDNQLEVAK